MKKNLSLFFLIISIQNFSQVSLIGIVKGNKGKPLYNTNIIASSNSKDAKFSYTITKEDGSFKLLLTKKASYKITISHIGFITLKDNIITSDKNIIQDFILKEDPNELEEVVITYKEPIVVKKDTTTYRTDAFTNGKERKLRQVLKKLPGVEVDRKGNVMVKGKRVTTVLVENKKFFTGDSKLAVNNIPADVINEIQVIEDYHESSLLKGLETSEEIALNINLKEDKKKFAFGNIEAGIGIKDRYVLHPTLFKYSPKVNYNFIGDFNNTNEKSFTLKEYINYEGGFDLNW